MLPDDSYPRLNALNTHYSSILQFGFTPISGFVGLPCIVFVWGFV